MRFASIVTLAAALAAVPVVGAATQPQDSHAFLGAVRCAAYESLPQFEGENAKIAWVRASLNSELRRQPDDVAARAHAEASAVADRGAAVEVRVLRRERTAACAMGAQLVADGAPAGGEV